MDKQFRYRTLLLLVLAAIVAFLLIRLSGRQPVAKISALIPGKGNIVASVASNGKVEPVTPYSIRAQLDTFVEKVYATEGQMVKKGQLLLELNVKDAASQLAAAKARLVQAEQDLQAAQSGGRPDELARINGDLLKAQAERDRLKKNHDALLRLVPQGAATNDEVAQNDLALTKIQAEVDHLTAVKQQFARQTGTDSVRADLAVQQAKSDIAALQTKVNQGRIISPVEGTLYALPVKAGDYVKVGDLLAEVADLNEVQVRAFIDEPELGSLQKGEPVRITWDALPSEVWQGKTEVIPQQVVARGSRSVGELLISVDNERRMLLPNTNVNVRITSHERNNVLMVPRGAVEVSSGQRFVFIVKDGVSGTTLEKRPIQVGIADATNYEVVSGIEQGEVVALPGDQDFHDGMRVRVVNMDAGRVEAGKDAGQ